MKKILSAIIAGTILTASAGVLAADNEPLVYMNGVKMDFETNPFIENDNTLVPMRAIFEAVGATVNWDEETRTVNAVRVKNGETNVVTLQIDSNLAFINSDGKELEVAPKIVNDLTFVPLRFVVESLGEKVEWDAENYSVIITTD